MRVLYKIGGSVAVLNPASECGLSVEVIARKDVPQGVAYKIVEDDDDTNTVSFDPPDGYGDPFGYWSGQ